MNILKQKENNQVSSNGLVNPVNVKDNNSVEFEIAGTTLVKYNGSSNNVVLPDTVTEIDPFAFESCDFIKSITISNSVIDISCRPLFAVFARCPNLEELIVDKNNNRYYSQDNCVIERESKTLIVGCKNSIIPTDITSIGECAFFDCHGLKSITIPDSVTSIGEGAFYNCCGLTSITLSDSITSIGDGAFCGCSSLTSIEIPNSVTSIKGFVFNSCSDLEEIIVGAANSVYYSQGNCLIERESKTLVAGCKNSVIPDDVKSIGDSAFRGCSGLTEIAIPNSVTNIERSAFDSCSSLTSIALPDSVTNIGECAFRLCDKLMRIKIPNSLTRIEEWVFYGCSNLTSIELPNSMELIKGGAFSGCVRLADIIFKGVKSRLGAVMAYDGWNDNIGDYTFHCEDGDFASDGSEIKKH